MKQKTPDEASALGAIAQGLLRSIRLEKPRVDKGEKREALYDERSSQAELMARKRAAEREIEIPRVKNRRRKNKCEKSLIAYAETYFRKPPNSDQYPSARGLIYRPLCERAKGILRELEQRIRYGGNKAVAAPRGFGKDTFAIVGIMWAVSYGHAPFCVFACYEANQAAKRIEAIKFQWEINEWLMEDFPEICAPVRALNRAPQRSKQQTYRGQYTRMEWGQEIVLPSVPKSKASGCVVAPGSLGGSIRGMNINGKRPSFVVISDPQTREVAKSPTQKTDVMSVILEDFGGLGAMDEPLACLALVTVIKRGDVADQLTDSKRNPQWSGERFGAIIQWPENMDLWEQYEILKEIGKRTGDEHGREANRFYLDNQAEMDRGAEVADKTAFKTARAPDGSQLENSSLQALFNRRWEMGTDGFLSEYQNEPPEGETIYTFSAETVASRLSECPSQVLPAGHTRLVEAIDIRGREIHFAVMSAKPDASAFAIVDYGLRRVNAPEGNLSDQGDRQVQGALRMAILDALRERRGETAGQNTPYRLEDGTPVEIEMHLVDSGWLTDIVYGFVRESGPRWRATKGDQNKAGNRRYSAPQALSQGLQGDNLVAWFAKRQPSGMWLFHLNADHWKVFTHERFSQDRGTFGEIGLFGHDPRQHGLFSKHICAEEWDAADSKFIEKSRFNHWLDCTAGCFAALDMLRVRMVQRAIPQKVEQKAAPKRFSMPDGRPFLVTERR